MNGIACRCLTTEEIVLEGLSTGKDALLEVREGGLLVGECLR